MSINKIKYSLLIPIYNEEKNINNLFNEIVDSGVYNLIEDIIYINDKSADQSLNEICLLKEQYEKIKIVNHESNLGQSNCLLSGAKLSNSEVLITIDGDCQNNPKDILELLKLYKNDKKVLLVGGLRLERKDTIIKRISSRIANYVRKNILDDDCEDTGSSLKVFDKNIFLQLPFFNGIHRFLPALYKASGGKTIFSKVSHRPRLYGESKYDTLGRLIRGIIDLIKVVKIIKNLKR